MHNRIANLNCVSPMVSFFIVSLVSGILFSAAPAWMQVICPDLVSSLLIELAIWILTIRCIWWLSGVYLKAPVLNSLRLHKGASWISVAAFAIAFGTLKSAQFALNLQKHANFESIASSLELNTESRLLCESKAKGWLASYRQQQRYGILIQTMRPFLQRGEDSPEHRLLAELIIGCASRDGLWSEYVTARRALKLVNAAGYPESVRAFYAYQLYLTSRFEGTEPDDEALDLSKSSTPRAMPTCDPARLAIWGIAAGTILRVQGGKVRYLGTDMHWRSAVEVVGLGKE